MEVEKRGSRGGFFHLFDWNRKSRKKLFPNNPDLFEEPRHGKERVDNLGAPQPSLEEVDENGESASIKGNSCYDCSSSVGDDCCETRAPGVVARLMGLDSLPTSGVCEPCSSSSLDSFTHKDVHYKGFLSEHHSMSYNNNLPNKLGGVRVNPAESGPGKVQRRPIERFQTEMLPPKSAKSIPLTHHKLLSPIKSPGFIPMNNASYVMEAAAKIIEPGPPTTPKRKVASVGQSSVPLRIRDLKEKMEAAQKLSRPQRPKQSTDTKRVNEQINCKRLNGSEVKVTPSLNNSKDLLKRNADSMKKKGKSISVAEQTKVNSQRKGAPSSDRSSMNNKEHIDVKSGQSSKSQPGVHKNTQKRPSTNRTPNVLKQNNQKQNLGPSRDVLTSKTGVSNQKPRKAPTGNGSFVPSKTVNRVIISSEAGSKKMGSVANDVGKESSVSKTRNISRKKQSIDGNINSEGIADGVMANKDMKSIKCNVAVEGTTNWGGDNIKKGMDVVSFTFTSPMKKPIPGSMSSDQVMEAKYRFNIDSNDENDPQSSKNSSLSPLGLNIIGADSLGVLLEQKLRELEVRVGSSHPDLFTLGIAASPTSSLQDSDLRVNVVLPTSEEHTSRSLPDLHEDKLYSPNYFDISPLGSHQANRKWQAQVSGGIEELSSNSNHNEEGKGLDGQHPGPLLSPESSFTNITCNSPDSRYSYSVNGSELCSVAETDEVDSWTSRSKSQLAGSEAELSDSASSVSTLHTDTRNIASTSRLTDTKESVNWELEYMRELLCKADLTLEDFALGHAHKLITPNLFDQLENQGPTSETNGEESSKLGRKVLFDYMGEILDLRSGQLFGRSCKAWARWATLIGRKGWLADELYNEILSWRSMGEFMVDELVDKDMSTQHGKWLDFELESFEEGVEIENTILTSLVDELVDDLFSF